MAYLGQLVQLEIRNSYCYNTPDAQRYHKQPWTQSCPA
jgi:hypothetical protein